jgi:outer membrane protein assembly factor BamA
MRPWLACVTTFAALAMNCILAKAQGDASSGTLQVHTELNCPPPVKLIPSAEMPVKIAELSFEGAQRLPLSDQAQVASSLKQRSYSGGIDSVTSELEERIRREWQQRGYFEVQVHGKAKELTSSPVERRVALTFSLEEGQQYLLGGISFKGGKAFTGPQALRNLFSIQDGDIFNSSRVAEGLQALSDAYHQLGYLNFTSVPETRIDERQRTIWLDIDLDEGKQFFICRITVAGLDELASEQVLKNFLQKRGDLYNQRLVELSMERLSSPGSIAIYQYYLNEKVGTVAVTVSFRHCGP